MHPEELMLIGIKKHIMAVMFERQKLETSELVEVTKDRIIEQDQELYDTFLIPETDIHLEKIFVQSIARAVIWLTVDGWLERLTNGDRRLPFGVDEKRWNTHIEKISQTT